MCYLLQEINLELRTEKGLLYNDWIDIENDTEIEIITEDSSFKSEIKKAGSDNDIYTITIYFEKKREKIMKVDLTDSKSKVGEKKDVGPALYTLCLDKVPYKIYRY